MDRLLWLSLLFTYLSVIEGLKKEEDCLSQPNKAIWRKIGQAADLRCTVQPDCLNIQGELHYEWFAFKENLHHRLNLKSDKYSLDGASLHIKSLNVNDSGIYHCAVALQGGQKSSNQHVGLGETLIVKDKVKTMVRHILLLLSLILLAIYSLAVLTLIILKKYGCNISICRRTWKTEKNNSCKKTQFHDVLQEMSRKRNLAESKPTASGSRSRVEAVHNELDSSADGIYQNV